MKNHIFKKKLKRAIIKSPQRLYRLENGEFHYIATFETLDEELFVVVYELTRNQVIANFKPKIFDDISNNVIEIYDYWENDLENLDELNERLTKEVMNYIA